jgi:CBS domain-containing protein
VLTQSDILKRIVLTGFDLARPIADVMTTPPHTLGGSASAYDAALEMATHGVRHILVVDAEDRLKGVISERDLFALQRIGLRQIRSGIESAADVEALQRASRDIRQLALNLLAQGIGAEQLTQFISALNDALTRRILELNLDRHDLYGVEYAWLAFGSEGRHEQTLSTDQDNGIVYVLPEWADKEPLKLRLLEFAKDVNNDLAACGFRCARATSWPATPSCASPSTNGARSSAAGSASPTPRPSSTPPSSSTSGCSTATRSSPTSCATGCSP